jgi:type IV pilus assembly protein PilB
MSSMLFGQCLGRVVTLSTHDVSEILEHQAATRRKFGEIALAWGLCRPQHVWRAWWEQLSQQQAPAVDLTRIGVDAQAVGSVPTEIAHRYGVVPLRCFEDQLVVATTEPALPAARSDLPRLLGKQVKFVVAERRQLDDALAAYYPAPLRTAPAA